MFPDSLRHTFEHEYGITCSQTYGIADIGLLGCECVEKSGFHIPEEVFIEIVDPSTGKQLESGQVGEVVVTPFEKTRPIIRYGTGDLSLFTDEPCACGQKSRRLLRIAGRVGDLVKVRGMFIMPKALSDALQQYSQVVAYQAIVKREGHRDDLTLRIEFESDDIDREKLSEDLLKAVSDACRVKFDRMEWVGKGTIPENRKAILDERTWE
jgi:phenylacetate-CoA ligase